ncbi:hypothetical protein CO110_02520, partial [Candidatus Desantisbacteria bacterium CG_4_9_14_3_um_filter_40_11]
GENSPNQIKKYLAIGIHPLLIDFASGINIINFDLARGKSGVNRGQRPFFPLIKGAISSVNPINRGEIGRCPHFPDNKQLALMIVCRKDRAYPCPQTGY